MRFYAAVFFLCATTSAFGQTISLDCKSVYEPHDISTFISKSSIVQLLPAAGEKDPTFGRVFDGGITTESIHILLTNLGESQLNNQIQISRITGKGELRPNAGPMAPGYTERPMYDCGVSTQPGKIPSLNWITKPLA